MVYCYYDYFPKFSQQITMHQFHVAGINCIPYVIIRYRRCFYNSKYCLSTFLTA